MNEHADAHVTESLTKWLLHLMAKLPWERTTAKGRKRDEPNKGEVFIVTSKRVWFFGWITYVIDVRFENETLNAGLDRLASERSEAT